MNNIALTYMPSNRYASIMNTPESEDLWNLLTIEKYITIAETATFLRKPAIEALAPYIAAEIEIFRPLDKDKASANEVTKQNHYKQLAGNMVWQILEQLGFEQDKTKVSVISSNIFGTATRYRLPVIVDESKYDDDKKLKTAKEKEWETNRYKYIAEYIASKN